MLHGSEGQPLRDSCVSTKFPYFDSHHTHHPTSVPSVTHCSEESPTDRTTPPLTIRPDSQVHCEHQYVNFTPVRRTDTPKEVVQDYE